MLIGSASCYRPAMKHYATSKERPIAKPLIKDLVNSQKADLRKTFKRASVGSTPLALPDLYQDAGGSYNTSFIYPQD